MYTVILSSKAFRQLRKLPKDVQERITAVCDALGDNPRPYGYAPYKSEPGAYRIRSGAYRVVYEIQDDILKVLVLKLGHRRDIF